MDEFISYYENNNKVKPSVDRKSNDEDLGEDMKSFVERIQNKAKTSSILKTSSHLKNDNRIKKKDKMFKFNEKNMEQSYEQETEKKTDFITLLDSFNLNKVEEFTKKIEFDIQNNDFTFENFLGLNLVDDVGLERVKLKKASNIQNHLLRLSFPLVISNNSSSYNFYRRPFDFRNLRNSLRYNMKKIYKHAKYMKKTYIKNANY
jgi:hypothetical protein